MVKTAGGVHALGYKIIIFTAILPYFRFQYVRVKQANKALSLRLNSMLPTWLVLLCTDSLGDSGGVILWSRPRYLDHQRHFCDHPRQHDLDQKHKYAHGCLTNLFSATMSSASLPRCRWSPIEERLPLGACWASAP